MNELVKRDLSVSLDFDKHQDILSHFGALPSNENFNCRLTYQDLNPEFYQLTIFYKSSYHLFERFEVLNDHGINILGLIGGKHTQHQWEHPDYIDLRKSTLIRLEDSPYWEHGKRPVIFIIDKIEILRYDMFMNDGYFNLTNNVFQNLHQYYKYGTLNLSSYSDGKFIVENNNREVLFGPMSFTLAFEHFYENVNSVQKILIYREANLLIADKAGKNDDEEIINYGKSLCLLMSYYWEKPIDFFYANVRVIKNTKFRTRELFKTANYNLDEFSQDFYLRERYPTFYDFVDHIDFNKLKRYSVLLYELIPRILMSKKLDDISCFMVLYNVIEKIRNFLLLDSEHNRTFIIKEEFRFKHGKSKTNQIIQNKIKEIVEIVEESDKEEFSKKASDKVSFIRKTGLLDQFDNLIIHLGLDPTSYSRDSNELIRIRNSVYHGKLPNSDVKPHNKMMINLIYDMLLKLITL